MFGQRAENNVYRHGIVKTTLRMEIQNCFRLQVSFNMMMCNNQKKNQQHQRKQQSPKDQTRESHEALSKQIPVSPWGQDESVDRPQTPWKVKTFTWRGTFKIWKRCR